MLIYCQNAKIAPTYCEILDQFRPILYTDKQDLLKNVSSGDIVLIDEDIDLCNYFLQSSESPIFLLISSQQPENEEIASLEKPVMANNLFQKVSLMINRQEKGLLVNFTLKGFTFNGQKRTINNIPLTQKQAELIMLLYENKNKVLSKEQILQTVFGYMQETQTHTLETHIYKLRQKIGDSNASFITTQDGGYCIEDISAS